VLNESSRVPTHDTPGAFEGQSNFHDQSFVSRLLFSAGRKSDSLKVSGTLCFLFRRYQIDFVFLSNSYLRVLKSQMSLVHFRLHNVTPILIKLGGTYICIFVYRITLQLLQKLIIPYGIERIRLIGESSFAWTFISVRHNGVIIKQ